MRAAIYYAMASIPSKPIAVGGGSAAQQEVIIIMGRGAVEANYLNR
jgi:hypothetical protein